MSISSTGLGGQSSGSAVPRKLIDLVSGIIADKRIEFPAGHTIATPNPTPHGYDDAVVIGMPNAELEIKQAGGLDDGYCIVAAWARTDGDGIDDAWPIFHKGMREGDSNQTFNVIKVKNPQNFLYLALQTAALACQMEAAGRSGEIEFED